MKLIIDGYNKTLRKKDNQIVVMEKDNEIYRISANKVSDITIMAKGHITFDALNLMAKNNIKLISIWSNQLYFRVSKSEQYCFKKITISS